MVIKYLIYDICNLHQNDWHGFLREADDYRPYRVGRNDSYFMTRRAAIVDVSLNFFTYIISTNVSDYVNAPHTRRSFTISSVSTPVNGLFVDSYLFLEFYLASITHVYA